MASRDNPITFIVSKPAPQVPLDVKPFHEMVLPDGTLWASFFRTGDGYLLRFPDLADFTVSASGTGIEACPVPEVSEQTIEHLYLNQVLPLALSRQFKLVLHASAVDIGGAAVAFMGASGLGKSTLAASFSTHGHGLLTDDGLQLEEIDGRYLIKPSSPSIRLWDDSREALIPKSAPEALAIDYTLKTKILAGHEIRFCEAPRPILCIFFLDDEPVEEITIRPVKGNKVLMGLIQNSFLLDIEEQEMLAFHLQQLSVLANAPVFYNLNYPRSYEMLDKVREAILNNCK